jgi:hypothetical protein
MCTFLIGTAICWRFQAAGGQDSQAAGGRASVPVTRVKGGVVLHLPQQRMKPIR